METRTYAAPACILQADLLYHHTTYCSKKWACMLGLKYIHGLIYIFGKKYSKLLLRLIIVFAGPRWQRSHIERFKRAC